MTVSKDLFLAILAMDSYNREYGAGVQVAGSQIGSATVNDHEQNGITPSEYQAWQDAGFYAISYKLDEAVGTGSDILAKDTAIISHRGTKYFSNNVDY